MVVKLTILDPAFGLTSDEAAAAFIAEAVATNDENYIVRALGVVARAKKMRQSAEQPYRSSHKRDNSIPITITITDATVKSSAKPNSQ